MRHNLSQVMLIAITVLCPVARMTAAEPVDAENSEILTAAKVLQRCRNQMPVDGPRVTEWRRFVYDSVFNNETRGHVTVRKFTTDHVEYTFGPVELAADEVSGKIDEKTGKPWELRTSVKERWEFAPRLIVQQCGEEKPDRYEIDNPARAERADESPWRGYLQGIAFNFRVIFNWPLPLHRGHIDSLMLHFRAEKLVEGEQCYLIHLVSRTRVASANFKSLDLLIQKDSWQVMATRTVDPTGNLVTVYVRQNLAARIPARAMKAH